MTKFNTRIPIWLLVVSVSFVSNKAEKPAVQHIYHFTQLDASFECPFLEGQSIVWQEDGISEIIAINGSIFSTNTKYSNFDVSSEGNKSVLVIKTAEMEDEGFYSCQNPAGRSSYFCLHMQNPPTLSISVNGEIVEKIVDLEEKDDVVIECNATGADPPVSVSLAVDDKHLILDKAMMDNATHTAYASSHLTVLRSHGEVECIDFGQKFSIYERIIQFNVTYPPNCTLIVEDYLAHKDKNVNCTCDANPEATKYTFTADGKVIQESVTNILSVDEKLPEGATNITCWADNGKLGFIKPGIFYFNNENDTGLSGGAIAAIVIAIALILVVIIGFIVYKRKPKSNHKQGGFEKVNVESYAL